MLVRLLSLFICRRPAYRLTAPALLFLVLSVGGSVFRAQAVPSPEQEFAEAGTPLMQVFLPADYGGHEQAWFPVADTRGLMHVGGLGCVMHYDGFVWHQIPLNAALFARALVLGQDGRLYVGAVDDLGYLEENSFGKKRYVSLLNQLPPEHRQMGAIFNVLANSRGVYFAAGARLIRWHEGRAQIWADAKPTAFRRIAQVGDTLYTQIKGGPLHRLDGETFTAVTEDSRIQDNDMASLLRDTAGEDGSLLYVSVARGIWRIDAHGGVSPWPTEVDEFIRREGVTQAVRLRDDTILLATRGTGLIQIDARGRFLRRIGIAEGLPHRTVRIGVEDSTGALWLGTNNGIVRLWMTGPTTSFRNGQGIDGGAVASIVRHRGQLYVATTAGVLRLRPPDREKLANATLEPVPELQAPTFSMVATPHGLVAGEDVRIAFLPDDAREAVTVQTGPTVLGLAVSHVEPGVLWGARGSGGGLVRLSWQDGAWRVVAPYGGVEGNLHSIAEDSHGELWTATAARGVRRIEFSAAAPGQPRPIARVTQFGPGDPFPRPLGVMAVSIRDGEPVFSVGYDPWRFNRTTGRPERVRPEDSDLNLQPPTDPADDPLAFQEAGVIWAGMRATLQRTRLDRRSEPPPPRAFPVGVSLLNRDSWPRNNVLQPGRHDVVFSYAVQPTRQPARIETQLRGYDTEWISRLDTRPQVYTNLPPGSYTFAVRAADGAAGSMGPEAVFSFSILLPWWRTTVAQVAGGALLIVAVFGLVRWRSVALHRRNEKLETMISARTAELREARDAAEAANRAKTVFLANMSHELRTPLNGILGYAQILRRDGTLNDAQRTRAGVIVASGEHLLSLINDVLDLAKVEEGHQIVRDSECDLRAFIQGVADLAQPKTDAKGLSFAVVLDPALPAVVRTDKQKLRQILLNLLSNAVKFTTRGGVTLRVTVPVEGRIAFVVEDTGPGIPAHRLPHLFQRFASSGTSAVQGTGLGLALSQRFAELMGGKIVVQSMEGSGSRFSLELALPTVAIPAAAETSAGTVVGYEGPPRRVLIVDDDATNRAVLRDLLSTVDFVLEEAADGETALRRFSAAAFDLVLLDLRFAQGMDGLQIARHLREGLRGDRVRIVAVSASAFANDRHDAILAGCDEFLPKPFTEHQLWSAIGDVLGLTWKRVKGSRSPLGTPPPFALLPRAALEELRGLAAQGDVAGLRAALLQWREKLPAQQPLMNQLLTLVSEYNLERVETVLGKKD